MSVYIKYIDIFFKKITINYKVLFFEIIDHLYVRFSKFLYLRVF